MKKEKNVKIKYSLWLILMTAALGILAVLSLCVGKYEISPGEAFSIVYRGIFGLTQGADKMAVNVVLGLRLPRIVAAILVGAALSVSGSAYQGIFRNPLVSPDFLGVSSGASIGAAVAILLSLGTVMTGVFAFGFGVLVVMITALIPKFCNSRANITLVLSGIIVGSFMSSILGFIKFIADPGTELASITYWTMGSFQYVSTKMLWMTAPVMIIAVIILALVSWWIDVLSMGEEEARSLGANTKLIRGLTICLSTILTAASVCISGTIGWVGLIVPHLGRMIVGDSNRRLIPFSMVLGGIFMLLTDTMTRVIGQEEMPVSIMTGIIGAPIFCYLLIRERRAKI